MGADMALMDPERLERERVDADRRYNDALTAFDRVIADATASTGGATRDDAARLASALIVFLQQITAFVETKDRQVAAEAERRVDALAPAIDTVGELRTQVAVLQRAVESLKRSAPSESRNPQSAAPNPQSAIGNPQSSALSPDDEYKYVGFEDQFRGADATVEERVRAYLPIFEGRSNVLDIGCGRGELLGALRGAHIAARGIDANSEMVAVARARGLDARQADALAYLNALPDASLGGIVATQVVEHLEPAYLLRLIDAASHKLKPGAPIVLETINAACWLAFFSSYIRDITHVRPIHPETLQYLLRASGFERVEIRYSAPVPGHMKMQTVDVSAGVLAAPDASSQAVAQIAHTVNANAVILNNLMFSHLDYAAVGYRI
jgi:O-antigen chain-terminating methyltransferase